MRSIASIKDRLKDYAKKSGRTVQDVFVVYILERVLYRISVSPYADNFTIKGGILLYAIYTNDFTRATSDIDLLGGNISNDPDQIKAVFNEILSIPADDPILFDLVNLKIVNITEFKKYHGIRLTTTAFLDRTRIPVTVDVGFGDVIYPERVKMDYPTLLDDDSPRLYAYSLYSIVSEKVEAIVSLGLVNSRYKDFYDLCNISMRNDFDGKILKEALIETFTNRHTSFDTIVAFDEEFTEDYSRQQRWRGFLRNKNVKSNLTFSETIEKVKEFLMPVIQAIRQDEAFSYRWDHTLRTWQDM